MAIFSRRTIERLIHENSNFPNPIQPYTHLNKLNFKNHVKQLKKGSDINDLISIYLNTEWEIVLLNVFSMTETRSGFCIWDLPIEVKDVKQSVILDQSNAASCR
jgi:hypothetical protein